MSASRTGCILFCVSFLVAVPDRAAAECGPRPVKACELINDDREVFVAKVIAAVPDDPFDWRVRVVRSYRGAARGEIIVRVFTHNDLPAWSDLQIGQSYLFYTSKDQDEDGRMIRTTPMTCADWLPLPAVSREELAFLGGLSSRVPDGRILGTLVRSLSVIRREPVAGVSIQVTDGKKTAKAATDAEGRFDIGGLGPGTYRVKAALPEALRVEGDTVVELVPHACSDTYLMIAPNTSISGRVILPLGVQVAGTQVSVLRPDGRDVGSTFADPFGRYAITGLEPGDYTVAINAGQYSPRVAAPFPATFAPGTPDRAQARTIHIDGPAEFTNVDITVPRLSEILKIAVTSRFEDGTPVTEQTLRLSTTGYGEFDMRTTTSADGTATVAVVKGVRVWLMGSAKGGCMPPVRLGPDSYPEQIAASFTSDGCRVQSNLTQLGVLQASAGQDATEVRFRVMFPDGTPAYRAHLGIVSVPGRGPYAQGFETDREGRLDLPVPLRSEFTIEASAADSRACDRKTVVVNTDRGVRWQARLDRTSPAADWDTIAPTSETITLALGGAACHP